MRLIKYLFVVFFLLFITPSINAQQITTTINFTWNDNSDNEKGFRLYTRNTDGTYTSFKDVPENTTQTTHQFTNTPGFKYCFAITAFNDAGQSERSNDACTSITLPTLTTLPITLFSTTNLPEYGLVEVTVNKPSNANKATITLQVMDADFTDEGELWINEHGPIALFPGASNTADSSNNTVTTVTFETPVEYWLNGVNRLLFAHTRTSGYEIQAINVTFETPNLPPNAPTNFEISS